MIHNLYINQLKNREPKALDTLVKEHQDSVFRICLGYLQNEHDAADITQEVFIKVLEKIDQYKGESKISTWIIRIAINLSLNFLRDNKKRLLHGELTDENMVDNDNGQFQSAETRKMLRKSIYGLPEKQRKVFILNYYLDLSYQEISNLTGFTISSVESLLFRARQKLRGLLNDFYNQNLK